MEPCALKKIKPFFVVALAVGVCVNSTASGMSRHTHNVLLPTSEFRKDDNKKGKVYFDLAKSLQLALDIYRELKNGASLQEIRKKYAGNPFWSNNFNHMIYLENTLLIPMGRQKYLKVGKDGWEEIDSMYARALISKLTAYQTGIVQEPLKGVSATDIRNIIFNTMPYWDRGDYIIQTTLLRILHEQYPHARITVVNKFPDLWDGIPGVTAVTDPKKLKMSPDAFDLVIDLNYEGSSDNWFYAGKKNKIIKMDRFSNACRYIDQAARTDQIVKDAPAQWDLNFNYNYYDYYLRLAESWGLSLGDIQGPLLSVSADETAHVKKLLKDQGVPVFEGARPYVVLLNPFSMKEEKELSIQEWILLVKSILRCIPPRGVILIERGSLARHQRMVEDLETVVKMSADIDQRRVRFIPHKIGYRNLMALVSLSDLVVGPDTSTAHIASAFNRDAVTIFVQRPGGGTLYFPPFEWSVFTPRIFHVEVARRTGGRFDNTVPENFIDFKPVESALASVVLLKDGKYDAFFIGNDVPVREVFAMEAFFDAVCRLARSGENERAGEMWMSKEGYSLFKNFVAELRPPYDFFYLSDIFSLNLMARDPLMLPGFSGFLQTSNLYKFVSVLAAYVREKKGASGVRRFDVDRELFADVAVLQGA